MKTIYPLSSEVIPKSIKKPLGLALKMTRWGKAFRIVKMEWEFPGQMTIFMIMEKVTPKSSQNLIKIRVELDFLGMWKQHSEKCIKPYKN